MVPEYDRGEDELDLEVGGVSNSSSFRAAASGQKFRPTGGCRDAIWSVFFVVHFLLVVVLGAVYFAKYHDDIGNKVREKLDEHGYNPSLSTDGWKLLALFMIFGTILAILMIECISKWPGVMLFAALVAPMALTFCASVFLFAIQAWVMAVSLLVVSLVQFLYYRFARARLPLSAILLQTVTDALRGFGFVFWVSVGALLTSMLWIMFWCMFALSVVYHLEVGGDPDSTVYFVFFLLLISLNWGAQVLRNLVRTIVASLMGMWYYMHDSMPANPSRMAMRRACWDSFGSVALGSFILSVIEALRAMVQHISRKNDRDNGRRERDGDNCLLRWLSQAVEYFNSYAFTQVAIYGTSYIQASRDAWNLLLHSGVTALINDSLVDGAVTLLSILGGVCLAVVGGIQAKFTLDLDTWAWWVFLGFAFGFIMVNTVLSVISAAVTAVFVCYAEDPETLQRSRPETYGALQQFHSAAAAGGQGAAAAGGGGILPSLSDLSTAPPPPVGFDDYDSGLDGI